ncbi:MAG: selenide, water dikinase [Flaviaesturariibacter sp.]|nr:selenide, water dikinase [Flaviaesturariibacter sp.]
MEPQEPIRLTQFSKGGGCGCKIAPSVLQQIVGSGNNPVFQNLLVGNDSNDDAAVYRINGDTAIISTTDFFVPIVDDPFDFGRIASANAISDVYAMGGTPLMAIAILGWPIDKLTTGLAQQVLAGARAVCAAANIPLAGGHTIDSADPIFGLAVTGQAPISNLKQNNKAQVGDLLFLTKPVGVGVLATALKRGVLSAEHYQPLIDQMTTLNSVGEALGRIAGVHAMTDVTGFGLLGHAIEMAEGSGVGIELQYSALQKTVGLDDYLKQRTIPDATFRNWNSYSTQTGFEKGVNVMEAFNVLPDPQTNGGLLIAVAEDAVEEVRTTLRNAGLAAFTHPIGCCVEAGEKRIFVK